MEWTPYYDANVSSASGYVRYANLSTARALWDGTVTAGVKANTLSPAPRHMLVTVSTQSVRFKFGADPTAAEGQVLTVGTYSFEDCAEMIRRMRFFEAVATAVVDITYFY